MHKRPARTVDGWALHESIRTEHELPGFLIWLVQASELKRQAAFVIMSCALHRRCSSNSTFLTALDALRRNRVRDVLRTVVGPLPDGLIGTLTRLSPDPLPRSYYPRLFQILAEDSVRARTLRQVPGTLTEGVIRAVLDLDEAALHPAVVLSSGYSRAMSSLNAVVAWARTIASTATDDRLRESVIAVRGDTGKLVRRWSAALDRLPYQHPIEIDDPDFRPLMTGREMIAAGREFRNCLDEQIPLASIRQAAFAVARDGVPMVFQLRPINGGWVFQQAWLARNASPSASVMVELRQKLRARGIHTYSSVTECDQRILHLAESWCSLGDGDTTDENSDEIEVERMVAEFQTMMDAEAA